MLSCFRDGPGGGGPRALALAAVRGGELLAFSLSHAVDGTAYQDALFVGAEGRRLNLALSLFHLLALAARASPGVGELMNGQHAREDPGLDAFKRGLGLEVVAVPARVRVLAPAGALLRRLRPDAHYRLTGRP